MTRPSSFAPIITVSRLSGRGMLLPAALALATMAGAVSPVSAQPQPAMVEARTPGLLEPADGPTIELTLDEALGLAEGRSEEIAIAVEGLTRAGFVQRRAEAERLPLVTGAISYTRTLKSEFEGLFGGDGSNSCEPLSVNPSASLEARVAELERAYDCRPGFSFGTDLPFGQANTWRLNVDFSQVLYAGGRIDAAIRRAKLGREAAVDRMAATRAQVLFDIVRAALDASLTDRLVEIAEETRQQAARALANTRARFEVGAVSEFELLRAQVAVDTLEPEVLRRRTARDLAYLRLKQLLQLPASTSLRLAIDLDGDRPVTERFRVAIAEAEASVSLPQRTTVTQAARNVDLAAIGVDTVRAQRRPTVAVVSGLGFVNYPTGFPSPEDFRTNWTVGVAVQMPLFTGGRIAAEAGAAQSDLQQARLGLALAREFADLDSEAARREWMNARAVLDSTTATVALAQRAYEIAELRYREGLSTQLELSDARLLLRQAQTDRAVAARSLHVARFRLALLPDLPVTPPGNAAPDGNAPGGNAPGSTLALTSALTNGAGLASTGAPTR